MADTAPDTDADNEFITSNAPGGWVAPLISTVVTLPLACLTLLWGMLSPMACDSCSEAESDRFDASFGPAFVVLVCCLAVALILLVVSWFLPRRPDRAGPRALFALLAPLAVGLAYLLFSGIVELP
ncbi:hypothetical protein EDD93_2568 [Streptomyces sp. 840.1]|uniref:hypothetical protein n=1 Tax=Streptomyces sp. 840.1 TaxID=2485152 RepID=UPI000FA6BC7D|nr:hypothetical protein [Streptomyces sp. 840.1]ROQ68112.1 hypothetical protein EDD93_2568 [Streptomyces sp. 840.1]